MCDIFDPEIPDIWRNQFWALVSQTQNIDWLILTKRPELVQINMSIPNVWLGASVEDQQRADERIPILLSIPAVVRFLSVEPMLGPVDLQLTQRKPDHLLGRTLGGINWVIFGGESGRGARPCDVEWIRDGVRQCRDASVPCFVKQLGSNVVSEDGFAGWILRDSKGGDPSEWPEDLRVREFPQ